jgi:hypothetical protein
VQYVIWKPNVLVKETWPCTESYGGCSRQMSWQNLLCVLEDVSFLWYVCSLSPSWPQPGHSLLHSIINIENYWSPTTYRAFCYHRNSKTIGKVLAQIGLYFIEKMYKKTNSLFPHWQKVFYDSNLDYHKTRVAGCFKLLGSFGKSLRKSWSTFKSWTWRGKHLGRRYNMCKGMKMNKIITNSTNFTWLLQ